MLLRLLLLLFYDGQFSPLLYSVLLYVQNTNSHETLARKEDASYTAMYDEVFDDDSDDVCSLYF